MKEAFYKETGSQQEISTEPESNEGGSVVEKILEIPPPSLERIRSIKSTLKRAHTKIHEYEQELQKENTHDNPDNATLNKLRWEVHSEISKLENNLGYTNYYEHAPTARQTTENSQTYHHQQYLPESIEAAFLASDSEFVSELSLLQVKISEYELLSSHSTKHYDSDSEKFNHFFESFSRISQEVNKLNEWLLNPTSRVSHSVFTHVTGETALTNILRTGKLMSAAQVPTSAQTGAYTSGEAGATALEKNSIYFDQNSISHGYGVGATTFNQKQRKVYFVTRGDLLLKNGLVGDRKTYEQRHPFKPGHNRYGAAFINKNGHETKLNIENFIIAIPAGASDLEEEVKKLFPLILVVTYKETKANIQTIRDFSKKLKSKFGPPKTPELAISCTDIFHDTSSTQLRFPLTINLGEFKQNISSDSSLHQQTLDNIL